jgi:hypothetical protein
MKTYLEHAEALDGLEFLSTGRGRRAGALGILAKLNETANDAEIDTTASSPSRFTRSTSTPSENSRCGSLAKQTPPSRHKRQDIPMAYRATIDHPRREPQLLHQRGTSYVASRCPGGQI